MKKLFFLLAFLSFAIVSCEKEPILTLSVEQIAAPANGNSTSVTVTTNNPWTVSGNDWCTVSPSSGEGGSVTVTVSVKENTTYDPRNCTLTFMSEGLTASISVSQETNYGIVLPKNIFEVSNEAQQISVEVKANVEYEVAIGADWITQSGTKALASKDFKFDIAENTSYDGREGLITIKEKNGSITETVKVQQAQKDAIIISSKEYNLSSDAHTIEVKLQANVELDYVIPEHDKSWISYSSTKALDDKIVCFNVAANEGYDTRNSEIIIKKKNDVLADTIKIEQAQKDAIILFTKDYELTSNAHFLEVKLQSNVDLHVVIPDSAKEWISVYPSENTKSLRDEIIILAIQENRSDYNRETNIIIKSYNDLLSDEISIYQYRDTVDLSIGETANCYIADAPGWYKFNSTVKGNSQDLISGGISAKVLWETFNTEEKPDVGDLIEHVSLYETEIILKVPRRFKDGNAVIAIMNSEGVILWSWHIWITSAKTEILFGQKYKHNVGVFMDRNLGALSASPDNYTAKGLLYQWGRKDPFLNGVKNNSRDYAASTTSWPNYVDSKSATGTIEFAIQNPMTFIGANGYNNDWLYTGNGTGDEMRWNKNKGVYDPCPPGWRVPSNIWCSVFQQVDQFDGNDMLSGEKDGYLLDIVETGVPAWYPLSHSKSIYYGTIGTTYNSAHYWTCDSGWGQVGYGAVLSLWNGGTIDPNNRYEKSYGMLVRCQKIEQK